jgi:hypothetical protein
MCEFVSWIEYNKRVYFLDDNNIQDRLEEYKKYNKDWREDIKGHGAITWFYPELVGKGKDKECASTHPKDYPKEIVEAIKEGRLTLIGHNINLLSTKGKKEYEKIEQTAWEEYEKIKQPAWEEYHKIEQTALEEYRKIKQTAWEEYEKIIQTALEEYRKIEQPAFWKVFEDVSNRLEEWR